jgi:hypothetical protein
MSLAIHINAGRDRNGNPRRGWIIADDGGSFIDFVDDGYQGAGALRQSGYGSVTQTTTSIDVTPSVYRDAYRQAYNVKKRRSG